MAGTVVWFDIPVLDLDRAIRFYPAVLGTAVKKEEFPGMAIGVLPHHGEEVGGCLFTKNGEKPADHGPLIYLNAQGRLDQAVAAVEANGGSAPMVSGLSSWTARVIAWRCIRCSAP